MLRVEDFGQPRGYRGIQGGYLPGGYGAWCSSEGNGAV